MEAIHGGYRHNCCCYVWQAKLASMFSNGCCCSYSWDSVAPGLGTEVAARRGVTLPLVVVVVVVVVLLLLLFLKFSGRRAPSSCGSPQPGPPVDRAFPHYTIVTRAPCPLRCIPAQQKTLGSRARARRGQYTRPGPSTQDNITGHRRTPDGPRCISSIG